MTDRAEKKAQLKKDKARLKELKELEKIRGLSVDETWEYVRLMNENTARINKLTDKLNMANLIILSVNFGVIIGWLIGRFI